MARKEQVMFMIYYISDTHFGHANIIRHCSRPFYNVKEMDNAMISSWNRRVNSEDTVYILGDLMFRSAIEPTVYLERLPGKKHLILGNHDPSWMKKGDYSRFFESVSERSVIQDNSRSITLIHDPVQAMDDFERDSEWLVYGHIHNNRHDDCWTKLQALEHALNAGVEINAYQPVTLEELIRNNTEFKKS
ncbi:MAG: metallophosphoesterase family protein [Eubacteriales bacterium]|nr:metallophosphoesterase family protein [Eubacteriales bacterium]